MDTAPYLPILPIKVKANNGIKCGLTLFDTGSQISICRRGWIQEANLQTEKANKHLLEVARKNTSMKQQI